jgi:lysophospholipase L1-like esterase
MDKTGCGGTGAVALAHFHGMVFVGVKTVCQGDGLQLLIQEDVLVDEKLQTITLAEGLDPNETHTVEVRKRNSARSSTAGLVHLELTDGAKLARPAEKERLIEFVGDSLTVGWSAAKGAENETAWSTKTEDGTRTYSKQVADAFNAEYMVTAISGRGVVMNNSGGGAPYFPDIYPKLDLYNDPDTDYDFSLQPDMIVINLGSNDATNSTLDLDVFKAGVISFIQLVREKNPNAKILWAYGMRDLRPSTDPLHDEAGVAIEAAIKELNDPNVYYMLLESVDPKTEIHLTHPIASSYVARGEAIIEKIEEITGWQ